MTIHNQRITRWIPTQRDIAHELPRATAYYACPGRLSSPFGAGQPISLLTESAIHPFVFCQRTCVDVTALVRRQQIPSSDVGTCLLAFVETEFSQKPNSRSITLFNYLPDPCVIDLLLSLNS